MSSRIVAAELADIAVRLATGAGRLVLTRRLAQFAVDTKSSPTDVVTDVDRAAESWLIGQLRESRPGDAVLGEEGGGRPGTTGVRWVIDPIDGTVNFVLGLPHYAVSVAAEIDGEVVAGCVHCPALGETFRAVRGEGAYLGEQRLAGPRSVPLERAVVGTGFGYAAARRTAQAAVVANLLPRIGDIRRIGAASVDLCAVAAGRLDGYFEVGLNPWDWAAGLLVAQEAGCLTTGLRGRPPGPAMVAVAGPELAPTLFATLEELAADQV